MTLTSSISMHKVGQSVKQLNILLSCGCKETAVFIKKIKIKILWQGCVFYVWRETTTSGTGVLLQARVGTKGNTCWRNADTRFFFILSRSVRSCWSEPDYIWHGWGHDWSHDRAVGEKESRRRRNVCGGNEYLNVVMHGPKWQFEELRHSRLQDM